MDADVRPKGGGDVVTAFPKSAAFRLTDTGISSQVRDHPLSDGSGTEREDSKSDAVHTASKTA